MPNPVRNVQRSIGFAARCADQYVQRATVRGGHWDGSELFERESVLPADAAVSIWWSFAHPQGDAVVGERKFRRVEDAARFG